MYLVAVGLNHRSAPIEVREKLSFPEASLRAALQAMLARTQAAEGAILSTCNRTELYAVFPHPAAQAELATFLSAHHQLAISEFGDHLYAYHGEEAVRHFFRVASGLDSLVLGEAQILRQVRDAFSAATEAGSAGSVLNGLFRAAIVAGKRSRTETEIGRGGFSIGHAAVDLARSIFSSLEGATILVLGAGKMSELTAKHLVASGSRIVMVANRTYEKAVALAGRLGGKAIQYDAFPEAMTNADVVISSTASPHHVVRREMLLPVMRRRRGRPLFLIDIAVPRDIAPDVADLENVFLYDIDDLEEVVADMARGRESERDPVERIINEEATRFMEWWRSLDAAPIVTELKRKNEEIRQDELARLRNQLPDLTDRQWQCIEAATRSMMNRASREPVERVKAATIRADRSEEYTLLDAARHLFGLYVNAPADAPEEPQHRAAGAVEKAP